MVSFGSNLEPRQDYLERALAAVCAFPDTRLVAASDVEETDPVDVPTEFADLKFLNRLAIVETGLSARDFSQRMHWVEDEFGRVRKMRNGPRTIDIDLIDYEGVVSADPELVLPHPRAMERDFVTKPWKALVRRVMKARRAEVPPMERAAKSHELCVRLRGLLDDARVLCCYEALKTELDLGEFIDCCRAEGRTVVFPEAVGVARDCPMSRCRFMVPRSSEIDLWVCPGLAFTERGERLGFGGGWYDRFLASAKPEARTVGVAYRFQQWSSLPQGPWDRRLGSVLFV